MIVNFRNPAIWILSIGILISMTVLVIYMAENDYSDDTLFFLLAVLRYSAFFICVCSIYLLVDSIVLLVRFSTVFYIVRIVFSFLCLIYGAGIIIMDAVIISITEGIE
jgi:hypothetical protein